MPEETPNPASELPTVGYSRTTEVASWWFFWIVVWIGSTLSVSVVAFCFGLFAMVAFGPFRPNFGEVMAFTLGVALGGGLVGLIVILHISILCWMFWQMRSPKVLAPLSGCIVGAVCGAFYLSWLTAPAGALGSFLAYKLYLYTEPGHALTLAEANRKRATTKPFSFSITDLFLRMTVVAVVLAAWILVVQHLPRDQFLFF